MNRLHYDTTHLLLCGAYDTSTPIADALPLPPATASANFPPAHITHGYAVHDAKMIHAGLCSVVDDKGAEALSRQSVAWKRESHKKAHILRTSLLK
jgi:hypothetical protein